MEETRVVGEGKERSKAALSIEMDLSTTVERENLLSSLEFSLVLKLSEEEG